LLALICLYGCGTTGVDEGGLPQPQIDAQAVPLATQAPVQEPQPEIDADTLADFERALALMRGSDYASAQTILEALTEQHPELAGPWVNLGLVHLAQNREEPARATLQAALVANPYNCDAHNQLGVLARQQGAYDEAERHYRTCLDVRADYAPAYLNLAILYELYMGRFADALLAYQDYQLALPQPDSRVSGWMMDLERRISALATR
jgi:tetratricopeptide (TPR) repeat protein